MENKDKTPKRIEIKTLEELGPNLPVGLTPTGKADQLANSGRIRNFKLRPFKFKLEREISEAKEKMKGATFGEFVTSMMSIMVHSVGSRSFDNLKEGERTMFISMMNLADVLYMYVWARYEAMGADEPLKISPVCPRCGTTLPVEALLGTIEVKCIPDSIVDLTYPLILRDGIDVRGRSLKVFKIAPMRWDVASNTDFSSTCEAARDGLVIRSSIVKAEGDPSEPFVLTEDDLEEMSKFDLETCKREIEAAAPGPKMSVDTQCTKSGCRYQFKQPINWLYENFFARGARATPG